MTFNSTGINFDPYNARTITGADIDGDGRLDLVMALYSSNTVKWYVGRGLVEGPL